MKWEEVVLFGKFLVGGISTMLATIALWSALGLPQVASQTYVDSKFQLASDSSKQTRSLVIDTQLQINKMTRKTLEAEKYQLEERRKTLPTDENWNRLQTVIEGKEQMVL